MSTAAPFVVLIPARMASTRLPNKPLADIGGEPMIVRVAQRAQASAAQRVVVATDDDRVVAACRGAGVECVMTHPGHASGSDRLAQACQLLGLDRQTLVVNVQGDEPLIDPALIAAVAQTLAQRDDCAMATAAHAIASVDDWLNPNVVKVVCDAHASALYFSRSPIPHWRDAPSSDRLPEPPPLRHIGIYAYRVGFLRDYPHMPAAPCEQHESLEQLRALWHGHRIAVHLSAHAPAAGVDTAEDLQRVRQLWAQL